MSAIGYTTATLATFTVSVALTIGAGIAGADPVHLTPTPDSISTPAASDTGSSASATLSSTILIPSTNTNTLSGATSTSALNNMALNLDNPIARIGLSLAMGSAAVVTTLVSAAGSPSAAVANTFSPQLANSVCAVSGSGAAFSGDQTFYNGQNFPNCGLLPPYQG